MLVRRVAQACRGLSRLPAVEGLAEKRAFGSGLGYDAIQDASLDLRGKTYCVTGSTDGIGKWTAVQLAQAGATVLVHGRSRSRVDRTIRSIQQVTGNPSVYGYAYDLSSLASTHTFADHLRNDVTTRLGSRGLDVLINCAATFEEDKELTPDGLEKTWAVNVAAPFILTNKIVDVINDRVVNVGTSAMADNIDFDNLQQEKSYERDGHAAYASSKAALTMWGLELANKLAHTPVSVVNVDPGTVDTKLLQTGWGNISHVAVKVEESTDVLWAATDSGLKMQSGKCFVDRCARMAPAIAYNEQLRHKLWRYLENQTGVTLEIPEGDWVAAAAF